MTLKQTNGSTDMHPIDERITIKIDDELPDEPKTPHEEVMFCVESTNDIVSSMYNDVGDIKRIVSAFDGKLERILNMLNRILKARHEKK